MTEKKIEETTFKVSGEGLKLVLALRHSEEVRLGKVVSMATTIRTALQEKYDRDITEKGGS